MSALVYMTYKDRGLEWAHAGRPRQGKGSERSESDMSSCTTAGGYGLMLDTEGSTATD